VSDNTKTVKVADTETFLALCLEADRRKRNRSVVWERLQDRLDPDGLHMVAMSMVHNDGEVRANWMLKMTDSMEPVSVWLDMSFDNFAALGEVTIEGGVPVITKKVGRIDPGYGKGR